MNDNEKTLKAVLYSDTQPTEEQEKKFVEFLVDKYGEGAELVWEKTYSQKHGFKLVVGADVYDWSARGHLEQFKEDIEELKSKEGDMIPLLKDTLGSWTPKAVANEIGLVKSVGDGIACVSGLDNVRYGEIVLFSNGIRGMVQDLREDEVGCIVFGDDAEISAGSTVKRTGNTAGVGVGTEYLGRVVDALGAPIDGKGEIYTDEYRPIENPAPGIMDRQPVNKPLETGIIAIDSMFPIGRGQRELIIGDRQTGKTAIAVDTIINQKGKDVVCIYVAIGQKASSVAQLVQTLKENDALKYTIVVNASASDSAPLQYIAPYSGCAMGEYFMENGKDVLIVYDDLSKHAIAYRSISLLLERAPGREAYPGDVFYLHSRLLERSAHLSDEKGGGSMTALPIVETQAGDISAYIPTNVISITDGQIFLESGLFFAGQRPAVNVGLSVSRVGGDAQTKAMKKAAGTLRLDLAQYREMEIFTQFAGDLDQAAQDQLTYGAGLMQMLKQGRYTPYKHHEQVIILVTFLSHAFRNIAPDKIAPIMNELLNLFETSYSDIGERIDATGLLSDDDKEEIIKIAKKYIQGR